MTSRERVRAAINHRQPDRVPIDLGATSVTGIAASTVAQLRQRLGLDTKDTPVKVHEPYQVLGKVEPNLQDILGVDVVGVPPPTNMFGFKNEDWKPWRLFDGTPVLVPGLFNIIPNERGDILQYPEGDATVPPSGRMPNGGYYFDAIVRQPPIDETALDPKDNLEEFVVLSEETLAYYERTIEDIYRNTDRAIVMTVPGLAFGDVALVPATFLKNPRGIRDIEEWYVSTVLRKDYVKEVYHRQSEIGMQNVKLLAQAVGDKVDVVFTSGTDFGTQNGPFLSPAAYREMYLPYQKKINDCIHSVTKWKTFQHSCGGVEPLIPLFIEAGYDILNPVQISAAGMDGALLKQKYGDRIVFWGGGVDTQHTLPFGTPDEVFAQVKERIDVFSSSGGFVFNAIHNIQANTPLENLLAMFRALGTLKAE